MELDHPLSLFSKIDEFDKLKNLTNWDLYFEIITAPELDISFCCIVINLYSTKRIIFFATVAVVVENESLFNARVNST
jgi:hypothetical protein